MKFNLKTILAVGCLLSTGFIANAQEAAFTLTLKMSNPYPRQKAFLYYKTGPESNGVDSAAYVDGKFVFKGKTLRPQRAFICLAPENKGFEVYKATSARVPVYLEKGNITISGERELKSAKLGGTPLNIDYQGFTDVVNSFAPRLDVLREKYGKANRDKDAAALQQLTPLFADLEQETKKAEERYFLAHLNSPVSLDWLKTALPLSKNKTRASELFGKMGSKVKSSDNGKAYAKLLNDTQAIEIGGMAPDFSAKNTKDEEISLSSFRGKYVLLDFWASWCGPCRKENPNVLKAYNAYKSKNFTVLGYSLDSSKMGWLKAVEQDALPWTQLGGFGQKGDQLPALLYGVDAIPANYLIDPNGKIIAMDLRGEELEKALAKFIKG